MGFGSDFKILKLFDRRIARGTNVINEISQQEMIYGNVAGGVMVRN